MSQGARAVDELFEEFEEDSPEEVIALAEREEAADGPGAEAFEDFATVPERSAESEDAESAVPAVDVDGLFGE